MSYAQDIRGTGPAPCQYLLVGSQPGFEEAREGRPFVGKTGRELRRFLSGDDLPSADDVFLTNVYRFWVSKDYVYTREDYAAGVAALAREFDRVHPDVVITLGREATRWALGDVDMDDCHGLPWTATLHDREVVVFPCFHIAAGFHNPEVNALVAYDFAQLASYLAGHTDARRLYDDPYPSPDYAELDPADYVVRPLDTAIDTEGSPSRPWSVQFSSGAGSGRAIRTAGCDLRGLRDRLLRVRPRVVYHNALHDLGMMEALGLIDLSDDLPFDDTMVMAYLLQVEPQGLKPLAGRFCGMQMDSYDSLVREPAKRVALDWLLALYDCEQIELDERRYTAFEAALAAGKRVRVLPRLPKTPLHKAVERCMRSDRPRELWLDQVEDRHVDAYTLLGEMPAATLDLVPVEKAIQYGCRDADATLRVRSELRGRLVSLGLEGVYDLELGTYPLIARMHKIGLRPDLAHFERLSVKLGGEIDTLRAALYTETDDTSFNANSGDQVADYLFDKLGLEGYTKTRGGRYSTNDKVLEALEHDHPDIGVIATIRSYREYFKLKHTFVDRLPDFVARWPFDGRVHATFRTTRVVTGRLAASDPNLLAMPKHGKFAGDFRQGWVPEPDHWLAEWDLSQIELRVLAHLSQDPVMLATFRGERRNPDGSMVDLHAALAERIFGVKPELQDKSKHRLPAKAINFGLPMGMTNKGLTVELRKNGVDVDEDDAQRWIDETMALYAGVPTFMDECDAEARRNGYIRCLSGRIRYIGGIRSRIEQIRAEARRFSFSTKIQEGAQWLMKQAEARVWTMLKDYWAAGVSIEPLIQIHDALTLELAADEALAQDVHAQMVNIMTMTPKGFSVPVETSGDWGLNWAERSVDKKTGVVTNPDGMRAF